MWMPTQMTLPQHVETFQKMGVKIDAERARRTRSSEPLAAIVSLGGCTASFVSPDGLIVTNHHCVQGALQHNSTPENNLVENGFLAKTRAEEKPRGPGAARDGRPGVSATSRRRCATASTRSRTRSRARKSPRSAYKELVAACEKDRPGCAARCRRSSAAAVPADRDARDQGRPPGLRAARARSATTAARSTTGRGRATPATSRSIARTSARTASRPTTRRTTSRSSRSTGSRSRPRASSRATS